MSSSPRPWYRRPGWWVLAAIALVIVAVAVGLQPLANAQTHKALDKMQGFRGTFDEVHVSLIPLRYQLRNLRFEREHHGKGEPPLVEVKQVEARVDLGQLIRGHLAARISLDGGKIVVWQGSAKPIKPPPDLGAQIEAAAPALVISRLEVQDLEVRVVMSKEEGHPTVILSKLEATLENFATRPRLAKGATTLALSGIVQRSGRLSVFITADPLEKKPTFAGQAKLEGLRLADLDSFLEAKTDTEATQGTLDLFARFEARNGTIRGGIKPVLKNAKLKSSSGNAWDKIKAGVVDLGLKLFSDRKPGRNALATVIPISGKLTRADAQLWPTVLGVVRNAFVEAITDGYRSVPPPQSPERQGPLEQARKALSRKHGVPRAQPPKGRSR